MSRFVRDIQKKRQIYYKRGLQRGSAAGFAQGKNDGYIKGIQTALGRHALLLNPGPIPSFEIGILQPFRELRKRGTINYHSKMLHELNRGMVEAADTIIFVRNVEPEAYEYLEWANAKGKQTIYVIDDNFIALHANSEHGKYYGDHRETYLKFLKSAGLLVVNSPFFQEFLQTQYNPNVLSIPASVDFDLIDEIEAETIERHDNQIVIGYEGTAKPADFALVVPALQQILNEYGNSVRLEFFGYVPRELWNHPQVSFQEEWMEYRPFIQKLKRSGWDIGLAPLKDSLFNFSKTNNKFREYSACGIAGIYSASPAYKENVVHEKSGLLVQHTTRDWYKGIKEMIENRGLRQRIRETAELYSRIHFSVAHSANTWTRHIFQKQMFQKGRELMFGAARQPIKILVISPLHISSYWVGVYQPLSVLCQEGVCELTALELENVTDEALQAADLIIFNRQFDPLAYMYLERAKELGKRTVYLIDDHFLAYPENTEYGRWFSAYKGTYALFLQYANTVLVGAPYFADILRNTYNPNVVCIPASVDFDWINRLEKPVRADSRVVIGYEGSQKESDFEVVVPALLQIMSEYGDRVQVEFFGGVPSTLLGHPQVSHIQHEADYKTFLQRFYQCTWDIGLAPLEDSEWNRCKTSNKFREYSACWIPGIYSALPPYSDIVVHGETGYITPHTTAGWYIAMKQMIDNPSMRTRMKNKAGVFARGYFSMEQCVESWRNHILNL
ncbi:glycosyltransferase [Paenibacillus sp. HW567]|uniref:glycosyltransferase n=1 Tax=Paenibacillus sp. HW567 TaxID=1034769 RepID=UPI0003687E00|nr:glycosyltransferase [Paenibacillus sp. HW567]